MEFSFLLTCISKCLCPHKSLHLGQSKRGRTGSKPICLATCSSECGDTAQEAECLVMGKITFSLLSSHEKGIKCSAALFSLAKASIGAMSYSGRQNLSDALAGAAFSQSCRVAPPGNGHSDLNTTKPDTGIVPGRLSKGLTRQEHHLHCQGMFL